MSLRVWLPLNGSLENKGLDDAVATLSGAVAVDNNGKIGKCYKFGTATGRITLPASTMTSFSECSVTFWVNILGWQTNWDTFFQAGLGGTAWTQYTFGILRNQGNRLVFCISNNSTASQGSYYTSDLTLETWYHLGFTYKAGHCCIYVNGELFKDYETTIIPKFSGITHVSIGQLGNAASYQTNCKMNDFRIYDHTLSPMEVKQISQGLVLHYPLNHGGLGQENLLENSHIKYDNNSYYVGNYAFADPSKLETGKTYTLSFNGELQDDSQTGWYFNIFPSPYTQIIQKTTDKEGRFAFSFTMPENGGSRTSIGCYSTPLGNRLGCAIWNVKLEEGSIATPWCPAPSDDLYSIIGADENVEYDCSGYGNNGTKIGTLDYSSDTPRYNVSTHFRATNSKIRIDNLITTGFSNSYTFSWWGKYTTLGNSMFWGFQNGVRLNGVYHGIYWNTSDGNSNPIYKPGTTTVVTAPEANVWHHYVMTGDNTVCKLYVDGELYGQAKIHKTISGNIIYINGWDSGTGYSFTDMDMSDFRIYATALSPEDVLDLYNLGAAIDTNNNLYGAMLEEV